MGRKRSSRPIDLLAAAAADDQSRHVDNHATDDDNDEDRSGSGSESNKLSGSDPDSMVTPKPIEEDSPNRKSSRKRSLPKHRLLDESEGSSKKARVASANRLWSEQDEISILQGMIDFKSRKAQDPYSDMNAFHQFVQPSISVHVSKKQLTGKIRKLKYKYLANAERGNVVGLVKPHDDRLFVLSKMIWGGDGEGDRNVVENGTNGNVDVAEDGVEVDDEEGGNVLENGVNGKVDVAENGVNGKVDVAENGVEVSDDNEDEGKDFMKMYPYLSRGWESDVSCSPIMKNYVMDNIRLVGSVKMREMDKTWKNLYAEQLKLYVKRLDLMKEHAQAVLDKLTPSDSS